MWLYAVSYLGGALTILSPCILPVLPFVFARADRSFARSGLPLLAGMGVTFAGVALLASVGGGWVVEANEYGRYVAMVVLALFGATLLSSALATRLMAPFVAAGSRLSSVARGGAVQNGPPSLRSSFLLGISTGLLWTPCAGPILGLTLTGAAVSGASTRTLGLLFAYAAGAGTSLALALLAGGRVFAAMKRSLGAEEWIRRGLGVAVLGGVVAIAFGLDRGALAQLSLGSTTRLEQSLLDSARQAGGGATSMSAMMMKGKTSQVAFGAQSGAHEGGAAEYPTMPDLAGAVGWINSEPLTAAQLRGKVVVFDFWTYSCINCLRSIPYVRAWAEKYKDHGLVVIGVHTPEFAFEKKRENVEKAVRDFGITYPVAMDNAYSLWYDFKNEAWPAHYFVDAQGRVRHSHLGEGDYDESERVIQQLLAERDGNATPTGFVEVKAQGAEAASDAKSLGSPETYLGYNRAENFADTAAKDEAHDYARPQSLELNGWGLDGRWTVAPDRARLESGKGSVVFRFHARDVHLVLGPAEGGKPVRFRVRLDGADPGASHGTDVDASGAGTVQEQRLYQLVRQSGPVADRTFEIEFLDPGVEAFAFTFG